MSNLKTDTDMILQKDLIYDNYMPKRPYRPTIKWTNEMIAKLRAEFPVRFNRELANDMGISWRSLVRKARELGIEKEEGFLDKNRTAIVVMIKKVRRPNPTKGMKGWSVPNSEQYRYKKGNVSIMSDPERHRKAQEKRNATIRSERIRIKYGLPQQTKLKLNVI